jgi:diguanylate cyclase (GGDEF)-like protein
VLRASAAVLPPPPVRASDVAARVGGDEFVALLRNASGRAGAIKARRVPEAAISTATVRRGGSTPVIGASAGVAPVAPFDTLAETLTRAAAAMYARKAERGDAG